MERDHLKELEQSAKTFEAFNHLIHQITVLLKDWLLFIMQKSSLKGVAQSMKKYILIIEL